MFVAPLSLSLQKLRLGDNRLGDEVFTVLSELTSLEVLNLSFNEIFEIPDFSLQTLTKLRELYISGNQLSTIPSDDLVVLQELRILHLNCNKLTTLPTELGKLKKLANLDVGNNVLKYNIANWHYDWNWNMNPELRYLNLSGNTRLEIKTKLSEMGFTRKSNVSDFSRLTNLRMLGLMDVTMPLHSNATPDESENRRVRTSLSQINGMAYGIADALGKHDNLSVIDLVIPNFERMKLNASSVFSTVEAMALTSAAVSHTTWPSGVDNACNGSSKSTRTKSRQNLFRCPMHSVVLSFACRRSTLTPSSTMAAASSPRHMQRLLQT